MTDREKLIELIFTMQVPIMRGSDTVGVYNVPYNQAERIADHLIENGVVIREKGEWVMTVYTTTSKRGRVISNAKFSCYKCGYSNGRKRNNFCPNCGADMKGE